MPIDPSIPLAGIDPLARLSELRATQNQSRLVDLSEASNRREETDFQTRQYLEREINRVQSTIPAAQELLRLPDDPRAIAGYLAGRKRDLLQAKAGGANVDTRETDEAMAAFRRGGVAEVKQLAQQYLADAEQQGLLGAGTSQAKPSALIEQYERYRSEGGQLPFLSMDNSGNDFVTQLSRSQVGAQYGQPVDVPGIGSTVTRRTTGEQTVIAPEEVVSQAEADRAACRRPQTRRQPSMPHTR